MEIKEVRIEGHWGTWYKIDESYHRGEKVFLMESAKWGDEAPCVITKIINGKHVVVMDEVYNGFNDLEDLGDCTDV